MDWPVEFRNRMGANWEWAEDAATPGVARPVAAPNEMYSVRRIFFHSCAAWLASRGKAACPIA